MQIPLLNGIRVSNVANLRTSYPRNLIPTPKNNGIAQGYMRQPEGLIEFAEGPGQDRGAINWRGILYRVMGSKLITVNADGVITVIGDVGGTINRVWMAYSFDRLAVLSDGALYYYDGVALTQVTDPNLGSPKTLVWIDGYFMMTDEENVFVTNLADPTVINPLKFQGNEFDPDGIQCVVKVQDQPYVVGKTNMFAMNNIGGQFFPFQDVQGSNIFKGAINSNVACEFINQVAFLGGGANEPPTVYLASNGQYTKIATAEIDTVLKELGDAIQNSSIETRFDENHAFLYLHLSDRTLVYDATASDSAKEPVWFTLDSGLVTFGQYRARNFIWCYGKWIFGDITSNKLGFLDKSTSKHFGEDVYWQFDTLMLYNGAKGAIIHELELVSLTGNVALDDDPKIATCWSLDGQNFSQLRWKSVGKIGNTSKRIRWKQQGAWRLYRIQRFIGLSSAHIAPIALEATVEALKV